MPFFIPLLYIYRGKTRERFWYIGRGTWERERERENWLLDNPLLQKAIRKAAAIYAINERAGIARAARRCTACSNIVIVAVVVEISK